MKAQKYIKNKATRTGNQFKTGRKYSKYTLYQSSKCIMEKGSDNTKRIYEVSNNNTRKRNK